VTPQFHAKDIFTLSNFLSPTECLAEIAHAESLGFEDAPLALPMGATMVKEVRNNERVMSDDPERASRLWLRLADQMPSPFRIEWRPIGLNERLRYYRYDPGQQFDWHQDGSFRPTASEQSLFTFMVYLNDGYEGGETSFHDESPAYSHLGHFRIKPERGMALLFFHPIHHRGDRLIRGRKYVLRSDVMYRRIGG
jgi:hypothetical protein